MRREDEDSLSPSSTSAADWLAGSVRLVLAMTPTHWNFAMITVMPAARTSAQSTRHSSQNDNKCAHAIWSNLCPNWNTDKIEIFLNRTQINRNVYHFNHTNHYLFKANDTSFSKICSLICEMWKFKNHQFETQVARTGNGRPFELATNDRVINETIAYDKIPSISVLHCNIYLAFKI